MSVYRGNRTAAYPSEGTGGAALGATPPLGLWQGKSPGPSKTYAIDMAGLFRGRAVGGGAAFTGFRRDFNADFGTVAEIAGQGGPA
jgi:hypothetical protein